MAQVVVLTQASRRDHLAKHGRGDGQKLKVAAKESSSARAIEQQQVGVFDTQHRRARIAPCIWRFHQEKQPSLRLRTRIDTPGYICRIPSFYAALNFKLFCSSFLLYKEKLPTRQRPAGPPRQLPQLVGLPRFQRRR